MTAPKCPRCGRNPATVDKTFGILPCDNCQDDDAAFHAPVVHEFYSHTKADRIQSQRDSHGADILQPWDTRGKPNPDFLKKYPDRAKDYFSKKDLKKL
jgi:hypothetical protein